MYLLTIIRFEKAPTMNRIDLNLLVVISALILLLITGCMSPGQKLYLAASQGDLESLQQLIGTGMNPDIPNEEAGNGTALHAAAVEGNVAAIDLLFQAGAGLMSDGGGFTPLHRAVVAGKYDSVAALLKRRRDPDDRTHGGDTPLHLAVKNGHPEIVKLLIDHGADLNVKDMSDLKETPLLKAVDVNHKGIVELLLSNGADPNLSASDGASPLHLAAGWGTAARSSENKGRGLPDLVQLLIDYGADLNARD
ncbi:MAG: ankyrin repeat domain-containing protein, partial [Planctomycetes bacterium]|nr:ankyrin repeat domain-containing protein [Planctomycetota bacterium]